jgi:predicted RNA polymerase sigma factor
MAIAKRRAIDHLGRSARLERKHEELGRELESEQKEPDLDAAIDDDIGDDLLRLVFTRFLRRPSARRVCRPCSR